MKSIWKPGSQESEINRIVFRSVFASNPFHCQLRRGEIKQKRITKANCLQVGTDDGEMNFLQLRDRLEFDHDCIFYKQVQSVFANKASAIIQRQRLLSFKRNSRFCQLDCKRLFVDRLEKTRSKLLVDA